MKEDLVKTKETGRQKETGRRRKLWFVVSYPARSVALGTTCFVLLMLPSSRWGEFRKWRVHNLVRFAEFWWETLDFCLGL